MNELRADERRDHLARSGKLFIALWTAALVALIGLVLGASLRARLMDDDRSGMVRSLGLTELSIVPSGRPPRHLSPPAVDLRHVPQLPEAP